MNSNFLRLLKNDYLKNSSKIQSKFPFFLDSNFNQDSTNLLKNDLHHDSRNLNKGDFFVCLKGQNSDGHQFIYQALDKNCWVIADANSPYLDKYSGCKKIIPIKNPEEAAKNLAPAFYHYPDRSMQVIGITGTNGKTTTAFFLANTLKKMNKITGIMGTISIKYPDKEVETYNTTTENCSLYRHLYQMKNAGAEYVVIELSSHGLKLERIRHLQVNHIIFTNFTRDHLDFHQSMEQYHQAKLLSIDLLKKSSKQKKSFHFWSEMEFSEKLVQKIEREKNPEIDFYSYALNDSLEKNLVIKNKNIGKSLKSHLLKNHFILSHSSLSLEGCRAEIHRCYYQNSKNRLKQNIYKGEIKLIGSHNLLNLLGVISLFNVLSTHSKDFLKQLIKIIGQTQVPGRLEKIENNKDALLLVDYAHTPDALKNVLITLKKLPHQRLLCVFGCGGDRDKSKRSPMGKVSGTLADFSWICNDNPRTENPEKIIEEIKQGIEKTKGKYKVIKNRQLAIAEAVQTTKKGDILLVAGKGHETYQIIGKKKKYFDDREIIRKYLYTS